MASLHDDVIKWKHFPRYWPFVRGIHRSPVNSPHKGQWRGALMLFFYLRPNKRLSKQWWGWWFETASSPLWRHCNIFSGGYGWKGPKTMQQQIMTNFKTCVWLLGHNYTSVVFVAAGQYVMLITCHHVQCGVVITWSSFSKILTKDAP